MLGDAVGEEVVGSCDGNKDGASDGLDDGITLGDHVGDSVGDIVLCASQAPGTVSYIASCSACVVSCPVRHTEKSWSQPHSKTGLLLAS